MMNQAKAIKFAQKAKMLAGITGCFVNEAIRYLAVRKVFKDIAIEEEKQITGLSVNLIDRLDTY